MRIEIKSVWEEGSEVLDKYPLLSKYKPEMINNDEDIALTIEINTLDEIRELSSEINKNIIYRRKEYWHNEYLMIYDDYME